MAVDVFSVNGAKDQIGLTREAIRDTLNKLNTVDDNEIIGIGGLKINGILQETITKSKTLTTNPVEKGVVITDHVIEDPLIINLVVEVSDTQIDVNQGLFGVEKRILEALPNNSVFLPERTATQLTKIADLINQTNDQIKKVDEVLRKSSNVFDIFTQSTGETTFQNTVFLFFDYLYNSSQPIQVQTKHNVYENMVLILLPEENTDEFTTRYNLTFQQITLAQTQIVDVDNYFKNPSSGQTTDQVSNKANNGKVQGKDSQRSALSTILG